MARQEQEEAKGAEGGVDGLEVARTHDRDIQVMGESGDPTKQTKELPPVDEWPDKPLLLRESCLHHKSNGKLAMENRTHSFETDLFVGKIMIRLRSHEKSASYFEGKRRLSSILITGKFKREVGLSQVFTGQEFSYPVRKPSDFIVSTIVKFFNLLAPLLHIHCSDDNFYSLSPLAQTVQVIHVSNEPVELTADLAIEENFGHEVMNKRMTREERKKHFSRKKNLEEFSFTPEKHYTFDFYNDKVDLETFSLKVLGMEFDLQEYIRRQPLRVLARLADHGDPRQQYLWNFELWHEKFVQQACEQQSDSSSSEEA